MIIIIIMQQKMEKKKLKFKTKMLWKLNEFLGHIL